MRSMRVVVLMGLPALVPCGALLCELRGSDCPDIEVRARPVHPFRGLGEAVEPNQELSSSGRAPRRLTSGRAPERRRHMRAAVVHLKVDLGRREAADHVLLLRVSIEDVLSRRVRGGRRGLVGEVDHLVAKKLARAAHLLEKQSGQLSAVSSDGVKRRLHNHERAEPSERALTDGRDERMGDKAVGRVHLDLIVDELLLAST